MSAHSGALEAVDRILNRGGAADDVVDDVLAVLHERLFSWVGVVFDGEVVHEAGERPDEPALRATVPWQGRPVGELRADPREPDDGNRPLLDRIALLISAQVQALRPPRHPT